MFEFKKCTKKFSTENSTIPSPVSPELQGVSHVEEMLIAVLSLL